MFVHDEVAHCLIIGTRVADPHHLDAIDADPYPAHHQSESNLRLMVYRSCTAPCLHCESPRPFMAPFGVYTASEFYF